MDWTIEIETLMSTHYLLDKVFIVDGDTKSLESLMLSFVYWFSGTNVPILPKTP